MRITKTLSSSTSTNVQIKMRKINVHEKQINQLAMRIILSVISKLTARIKFNHQAVFTFVTIKT